MTLVAEARLMLIKEQAGLESRAGLIAWADGRIDEIDDPPHFLFDISMGDNVEDESHVDLRAHPVEETELRALAAFVMAGVADGSISLECAGRACEHLANAATGPIESRLQWIACDIDLLKQGYKDELRVRTGVIEELARASAQQSP